VFSKNISGQPKVEKDNIGFEKQKKNNLIQRQDLLLEMEENSLGYHLGNVYIGTPTCANGVAFIERDSNNLQIMINVISSPKRPYFVRRAHLILSSNV
jgi:hypothetical protein